MKKILMLCLVVVGAYFAYQHYGLPSFSESGEAILFVAGENCPPCDAAVDFLYDSGVEYTLCDISVSDENMKKFRRFNGRNLPLFVYDGKRIEGYDETLLSITVNNMLGYEGADAQEVVMYGTEQCVWCRKARTFFQEHNIEFVDYDIRTSKTAKQEFDELGGRGTPLIFIGDNRFDGFNKTALEMALKQAGLM